MVHKPTDKVMDVSTEVDMFTETNEMPLCAKEHIPLINENKFEELCSTTNHPSCSPQAATDRIGEYLAEPGGSKVGQPGDIGFLVGAGGSS